MIPRARTYSPFGSLEPAKEEHEASVASLVVFVIAYANKNQYLVLNQSESRPRWNQWNRDL